MKPGLLARSCCTTPTAMCFWGAVFVLVYGAGLVVRSVWPAAAPFGDTTMLAAIAAAFVLGFLVRGVVPVEPVAHAQGKRVFELRTYTAPEGKLAELHARFRNHTMRIFKKHGSHTAKVTK